MREMSAVAQVHTEDSITRFEEGIVDTDIGSSTRESLDIGMVSMKNLLRALDSNSLHLIREFLSAVVAFSGETFCVFIHKNTSKCFLDCRERCSFQKRWVPYRRFHEQILILLLAKIAGSVILRGRFLNIRRN
jgi:hypothetical protein